MIITLHYCIGIFFNFFFFFFILTDSRFFVLFVLVFKMTIIILLWLLGSTWASSRDCQAPIKSTLAEAAAAAVAGLGSYPGGANDSFSAGLTSPNGLVPSELSATQVSQVVPGYWGYGNVYEYAYNTQTASWWNEVNCYCMESLSCSCDQVTTNPQHYFDQLISGGYSPFATVHSIGKNFHYGINGSLEAAEQKKSHGHGHEGGIASANDSSSSSSSSRGTGSGSGAGSRRNSGYALHPNNGHLWGGVVAVGAYVLLL